MSEPCGIEDTITLLEVKALRHGGPGGACQLGTRHVGLGQLHALDILLLLRQRLAVLDQRLDAHLRLLELHLAVPAVDQALPQVLNADLRHKQAHLHTQAGTAGRRRVQGSGLTNTYTKAGFRVEFELSYHLSATNRSGHTITMSHQGGRLTTQGARK